MLFRSDESGSYTVYCWEPAFLTASPDDIPWVGGMYLDADGRLCAYEQYTYFVTKGETGDFPPCRFLFWDLYNGETEEVGKARALQRIRQAFEQLEFPARLNLENRHRVKFFVGYLEKSDKR